MRTTTRPHAVTDRATSERLPGLTKLLDGPPVALPRALDRLHERWWAARPRTRAVVVTSTIAVVLLAGFAHLASSPFGPPTSVIVADRELRVGERVEHGALRRTGWPSDLVPAGAMTGVHPSELTGRTVQAPVPAGGLVTDNHLGTTGVAGLLADGQVAVAIPAELLAAIATGVQVDLISRDINGLALELARHATVIDQDDTSVWVAVDEPVAAAVAAAAASGTITAVVRPS